VHKIKQVLHGYYLNTGDHRANIFVMRCIWVNTVNTVHADVIMNEKVLVFHFQIRKLYIVILLYSDLQKQRIYTAVSAASNLFPCFIQICSVQMVRTMQSGYARP